MKKKFHFACDECLRVAIYCTTISIKGFLDDDTYSLGFDPIVGNFDEKDST